MYILVDNANDGVTMIINSTKDINMPITEMISPNPIRVSYSFLSYDGISSSMYVSITPAKGVNNMIFINKCVMLMLAKS